MHETQIKEEKGNASWRTKEYKGNTNPDFNGILIKKADNWEYKRNRRRTGEFASKQRFNKVFLEKFSPPTNKEFV